MNSRLLQVFLTAGCLLSLATRAVSTPIQRADVAAEPAWVLHVDCDQLRSTVIGQYILSELDKPESQAKIAAFQAIFNLDPRKQVHSLTLYSTGKAPEDGVLLLYADFDGERLATLAKAANDYQSSTHNQHTIHSWVEEKKHPQGSNHHSDGKPRTFAAIYNGRVIVFGQRETRVADALDVLDHAVSSLATSSALPSLGAASDTGFVQGAARKLDLPGKDPSAALFKLAKSARLRIGEANHQLSLTLDLEANDEEVAKYMTSIAQGLLALVKLQNEKAESVKLANAISLKQEGPQMLATLQLPASDVVEMMKADAARRAQK